MPIFLMWSNSSSKEVSVICGTKRLMSSANLNRMLIFYLRCKSPSIITYAEGPMVDPWIIRLVINMQDETDKQSLQTCVRLVKNKINQLLML